MEVNSSRRSWLTNCAASLALLSTGALFQAGTNIKIRPRGDLEAWHQTRHENYLLENYRDVLSNFIKAERENNKSLSQAIRQQIRNIEEEFLYVPLPDGIVNQDAADKASLVFFDRANRLSLEIEKILDGYPNLQFDVINTIFDIWHDASDKYYPGPPYYRDSAQAACWNDYCLNKTVLNNLRSRDGRIFLRASGVFNGSATKPYKLFIPCLDEDMYTEDDFKIAATVFGDSCLSKLSKKLRHKLTDVLSVLIVDDPSFMGVANYPREGMPLISMKNFEKDILSRYSGVTDTKRKLLYRMVKVNELAHLIIGELVDLMIDPKEEELISDALSIQLSPIDGLYMVLRTDPERYELSHNLMAKIVDEFFGVDAYQDLEELVKAGADFKDFNEIVGVWLKDEELERRKFDTKLKSDYIDEAKAILSKYSLVA